MNLLLHKGDENMKWIPKYPKNLWILALGMLINVTGSSFLWPLNSIYMTQHLGQTLSTAGIVLMLHAGSGIFGNLLGGNLYDKIGGKKTISIGVFLASATVFGLAIFDSWFMYIALMIILGFSNGIVFPAIYAMAGGVWPEGGRKSFNVIYVTQNVGVAVGTAIGGLVAQFSFTLVFLVNGLSYLFFLSIIYFGISERVATLPRAHTKDEIGNRNQHVSQLQKKRSLQAVLSLGVLSTGFMLVWISYVQWQTSISVYMQDLGFSLPAYSLLWTINGVLIIIAQPISSFLTDRIMPNIRTQLILGSSIFVVSMLVVSQTDLYTGFVVAMIIMTIGEIFIWPAVPTAANALAPEGRGGFFQGVVGSAATAGRMLGPFIGGVVAEAASMEVVFYVMAALCALSIISFAYYDVFTRSWTKENHVAHENGESINS